MVLGGPYEVLGSRLKALTLINPYPANVENMVSS